MTEPVRDLVRATPGDHAILPGIDPRSTPGIEDRDEAEADAEPRAERLSELQERLWAEGTRSVVLVLQGMDTSGKSGTVTHVMSDMSPMGVDVTAFKKPTAEELAHHFLWRIERALPSPGRIMVFDRSHYEDVLIARVRGLVPPEELEARYGEIVEWERRLVEAGTTIVKVMLHISYDEQRERLLARLDDPNKRWKFSEGDLDERGLWPSYMEAYEIALRRTSTDHAPWYVVPADRKWYRNWAVARILDETLTHLDPRYPQPALDVEALKARLAPPN
jgi:PPK2 family polyphosphate:nucleotide phosphotransferase